MALLIDNKAVFFHNPKTGGLWVRKAIENAGIECYEIMNPIQTGQDGNFKFSISDMSHMPPRLINTKKYKIAFIRNPLDYLKSTFKYFTKQGWPIDKKDPLYRIKDKDFNKFVERYVFYYPGQVGQLMKLYTEGVHFVGKQENLVEHTILALKTAGVEFNEKKIKKTKPVNKIDMDIEYTPINKQKVVRAELDFIEKHYPDMLWNGVRPQIYRRYHSKVRRIYRR